MNTFQLGVHKLKLNMKRTIYTNMRGWNAMKSTHMFMIIEEDGYATTGFVAGNNENDIEGAENKLLQRCEDYGVSISGLRVKMFKVNHDAWDVNDHPLQRLELVSEKIMS
jgi:sugar phosphate isomerase/epimerase